MEDCLRNNCVIVPGTHLLQIHSISYHFQQVKALYTRTPIFLYLHFFRIKKYPRPHVAYSNGFRIVFPVHRYPDALLVVNNAQSRMLAAFSLFC